MAPHSLAVVYRIRCDEMSGKEKPEVTPSLTSLFVIGEMWLDCLAELKVI